MVQTIFPHGGVVNNSKLISGEAALDASNPTPITTPLKVIEGVSLTIRKAVAPGLGTSVLTYDVVAASDGTKTVNVYAWMPTSAANPTLIASTGTETFTYGICGA